MHLQTNEKHQRQSKFSLVQILFYGFCFVMANCSNAQVFFCCIYKLLVSFALGRAVTVDEFLASDQVLSLFDQRQ
jgi:hypothetical protein